ncbi:hypothetical protein FJY69_00905 [candidate division WOR-3 bacterium]|nr:hypothetical protein [candidate division WOR-3 bacterium]
MRLAILTCALSLLISTAAGDGEFLVDTGGTIIPAPGSQNDPAVSFNGTDWLAVWSDCRSGPGDVFGARVSRQGVVLDTAGIPISTATDWQRTPVVGFDGSNWLVVWEDRRSGMYEFDIYAARVSRAGQVLDPDGIPVATAVHGQGRPAICFNGADWLVAWEDERRGQYLYDVYAARVTPAGVVLDPNGIPISTTDESGRYPAVSHNGADWLVAWSDERGGVYEPDIYAARVNPAGAVLEPGGFRVATATRGQRYPDVGFDGANWLVAWEDERSGQYLYDLYGARVTGTGAVLDPEGIAISTATGSQSLPSVGFDGQGWLVVWTDSRGGAYAGDIYAARVSPAGVVLDPSGLPVSTATERQTCPAVASDGTNSLVVWEDWRWYGGQHWADVYAARITQSGAVLDPEGIPAATSAYDNWTPAAAFDGANYLAVWADYRNGSGYDVYGARLGPDGAVLDPEGIAVSTATGPQEEPDVAFDGDNFLVVWGDRRAAASHVYGARLDKHGTVLDPNGIPIGVARGGQFSPAVACGSASYLVVWEDARNSYVNIYGARVSRDGEVLDPGGIPISLGSDMRRFPDLTFDGVYWLVVWTDQRSGSAIYAARVNQAGDVLDPGGIPVSVAANYRWYPTVSFDGTNSLVVWTDWRRTPDTSDTYAARVSRAGAVLDPEGIPVSTAAGWQYHPSVCLDSAGWLAAWYDSRSGSGYDLYGARVSPDGAVLAEFPLVISAGNQYTPAVVSGSSGQTLCLYAGWTGTVSGRTYNAMRTWAKLDPSSSAKQPAPTAASPPPPAPTIVREVLWLAPGRGHHPDSPEGIGLCPLLLDATGRRVMELAPGANDVHWLPPGVYFVIEHQTPVRKVILE